MDKKVMLIAVVAVVAVAVAAIAVMGLGSGPNDNNQNGTNNSPEDIAKGGFYSWDPKILEINSAYTNGSTPRLITKQTVELYESIYGKMPSIAGKTRSSIPANYLLDYDNYVTKNGDGSLTVKNYNSSSDGLCKPNTTSVLKGTADKLVIYQASYVDTVYNILCAYYGEKVGSSPQATAKLWEIVVGLGSGVEATLEKDFKIDVPDGIKVYDKGENMVSNLEALAKDSDDCIVVLISEYDIRNNRNVKQATVDGLESSYDNLRFIFTSTNGLDRVFSSIEMVGFLLGMDNSTDATVTEMLLDVYVMQKAIDDMKKKEKMSYYLENTSGKAAGYGNISTFVLTDILKMTNIADSLTLMEGTLSNEQIVTAEPDVVLFYANDKRTMDERMRVTVA